MNGQKHGCSISPSILNAQIKHLEALSSLTDPLFYCGRLYGTRNVGEI